MVANSPVPEQNEVLTAVFAFTVLWVIDLTARRIWPYLLPAQFFKDPKSALVLSRHTMDITAMGFFFYLATQIDKDPEYQKIFQMTPVERTYFGHPTCQLLVLCQLAYQTKNLMDTYMYGDGIVFYLHHIGTGILCAFGTYPFLHAQVPFFLGHVEISTAFLCVLGLFDDEHGVVGLGAMFPKLKIIFAACFAGAFIPIRCIIWPYFSYFFWLDMLAVLEAGPHSAGVLIYSLVVNAGLTVLQFYWLYEIIVKTKQELGGVINQILGKNDDLGKKSE